MSLASLCPVIFLITECHSRLNSVGSGLPIRLATPKLVTPSLHVWSFVGWSGVYALRRGSNRVIGGAQRKEEQKTRAKKKKNEREGQKKKREKKTKKRKKKKKKKEKEKGFLVD